MTKRKVWFVTRPQRDPQFHVNALRALDKVTNHFSSEMPWLGNRELQKRYEQELANSGLKRDHVSNDGSGARTWVAMLRTYDYVYLNEDGCLVLNKVGQKIIDNKFVWKNTRKQILTLQIPNPYFLSSGFRPKFENGFRIRPVRFIIKLAAQQALSYYVTKEEITLFCLKAKKDSDLGEVINEISDYRRLQSDRQSEIIAEISSAYEYRNRADSSARNYIENNSDVAHTFMILAEYTGLVTYFRGDALRVSPESLNQTKEIIEYFDSRYPFNTRYLISDEAFSRNAGLDIDSYKASSMGNIAVASNKRKKQKVINNAIRKYPDISHFSINEIEQILIDDAHFSPTQAKQYAEEIKQYDFKAVNNEFIEAYLNNRDDRQFEEQTELILQCLGFKTDFHPDPVSTLNESNENIDVLLHVNNNYLCLVDSKNYKEKFGLTAALRSHMATSYIPGYNGFQDKKVKYFCYVTAKDISGVKNLQKVSEIVKNNYGYNVHGMMISANALLNYLDYCIANKIPSEDRQKNFLKLFTNEAYTNFNKVLEKMFL
ncbi:AlwI family type II restriction endonuclease [Sporolactobacillus sp. STCC-11]|uniref:AlwI family type II restriction endonuclease n=1 Tax=Sporolactobacillus caesalpiniae TaxID=3230362 RepID=UPI00339B0C3A